MSTLAPELPGGQTPRDIHGPFAAGATSIPQANVTAMPEIATPAGPEFGPDQRNRDLHDVPVRADQFPDGQGTRAIQTTAAVGNQAGRGETGDVTYSLVHPATKVPAGQTRFDVHSSSAGRGPILVDPMLALAADTVDDLERVRIATENRIRQLTRFDPDKDGRVRGRGIGPEEIEAHRLILKRIVDVEHAAELELKRQMRHHPLGPWVAARVGVGEKQAARLLAAIGDPYWNTLPRLWRPRTVSELWAFCGYHVLPVGQRPCDSHIGIADGAKTGSDTGQVSDESHGRFAGVAAARRRGQKANWSATAKMRAYVVAESCVKQRCKNCIAASKERDIAWKAGGGKGAKAPWAPPPENCTCAERHHYRVVYDDGRIKYAEAVHAVPCVRCGPAGKPAPEGSPLSEGHKGARAVRLVSKAILRDLWIAARDIHEAAPAETAEAV